MKNGSSPTGSSIKLGLALLGFVPVMVAIAAIGFVASWSLIDLVRSGDRAARMHQTIDHLENLRSLLDEAETRQRDYLITGDQYNLDLYRTASAKIDEELNLLERLSRDEPVQQQHLATLARLIRTRTSSLEDSIQVRAQMGAEPALEMARSSSRRSLMDDILRRMDDMIDEERVLATNSKPDREFSARPAIWIIAGGCVVGLVFLLLTALYILRTLLAMRSRLVDLSRSNTALQDQGRFMDAVLDSMDAGVVLLDRDLKVVQSNPIADELLKMRRTSAFDGLKAELGPGTAGDRLTLALEHLQTRLPEVRNSETTELAISGPDKADVTSIAATARAIRDDAGALQGGVLLFRDVSGIKSVERELEAKEASLISLFHYGLEAALIATLDDSVSIGVNEGFLRLWGYSRDEVIGRSVEELKVFGSPAELGYALDRVRTGQVLRDRSLCFSTKAGRAFDATLSVLPIEFSGLACALFILSSIEWQPRYFWSLRGLFQPRQISRRTDLVLKN